MPLWTKHTSAPPLTKSFIIQRCTNNNHPRLLLFATFKFISFRSNLLGPDCQWSSMVAAAYGSYAAEFLWLKQQLVLISIIVYHHAHYHGYFDNNQPFVQGKKERTSVNKCINDVKHSVTFPWGSLHRRSALNSIIN